MKKGQITTFVIIGVILLFIIGIALYISGELQKNLPPEEQFTEQVPVEVQPIKTYIQDCLAAVTKDGIIHAGLHGGYVFPEDYGLDERITPTNSPGIDFVPATDTFIPYWFHMASPDSCKDCMFSSHRLPLSGELSVETEIAQYVLDNMAVCEAGLSGFEDQGFLIETEEPEELLVIIGPDKVSTFLDWPITINTGNNDAKMSKFQTVQSAPLGEMYALATEISMTFAVSDNKLLEHITREIIDGHSIGDDPAIPPTSGPIDLGFQAPRTWMLSQTREELQQLLAENIPLVQVENSRNFRAFISDNPFSQKIYNRMRIPLRDVPLETLNQYEVDFIYLPWWEPYLKIRPSSGELIGPDTTTIGFPIPLQIKRYDYAYDLSYPVVVSLEDPDAFAGQGYTFQFALEVNLRNNEPIEGTELDLFALDIKPSTLYDDPANRFSGDVTIQTIDYFAAAPLEDVVISYACGDESVILGTTRRSGDAATLTAKLPVCFGGVLTAYKEDYYADGTPLTTHADTPATATIELYEKQELDVRVKKRELRKDSLDSEGSLLTTSWQYHPETTADLHPDEEVFFVLTRQGMEGENFNAVFGISGEDLLGNTVILVPGEYKIEAYLLRHFGDDRSLQEFVIPSREECYDTEPLNPFGGEECQTIPEVRFNESLSLGGVLLDESTSGFVNITKEDLLEDRVTFYIVGTELKDMTVIEDLDFIDKGPDYGTTHRESLLPRFG